METETGFIYFCEPILVAARSKEWVCRCSLAGNACSNPSGDMDVCLLWCCVVTQRSLHRADHSTRTVLPSVVCLNVFVNPR